MLDIAKFIKRASVVFVVIFTIYIGGYFVLSYFRFKNEFAYKWYHYAYYPYHLLWNRFNWVGEMPMSGTIECSIYYFGEALDEQDRIVNKIFVTGDKFDSLELIDENGLATKEKYKIDSKITISYKHKLLQCERLDHGWPVPVLCNVY